jgi:hypothetical protein
MVYGQKGIALMVSVALASVAFHRLLKQVIQRGRRRGETGDVLIFTRPVPRARRDGLFSRGRTLRILTSRERNWGPGSAAWLEECHAGVRDGGVVLVGDASVVP